jgi:hypothetical protein
MCARRGQSGFPDHEVKTVTEIGWRGSKDGPLLAFAQTSFDAFITIDGNLEHQQDLKKLRLGIVVAHVGNNEIASYRAFFADLLRAAESVKSDELIHVRSAE